MEAIYFFCAPFKMFIIMNDVLQLRRSITSENFLTQNSKIYKIHDHLGLVSEPMIFFYST